MAPRTVGTIALCPTGDSLRGYYFYSLGSGKRINWYSRTELPMSVEVEKRVEELAKNANGLAILGEDDEPSKI